MADARVVANRFLELAERQGRSLTPMQLLKLVYIAHGWKLGLMNRPLIDQRVEAWQYGPVIRDLYNATRMFGRGKVQGRLAVTDQPLDPADHSLIEQVFTLYGQMDGIALSNITHMKDTPWEQTYRHGAFGTIIPADLISAHYRRLAEERTAVVQ